MPWHSTIETDDHEKWFFHAQGSFNHVYINKTRTKVYQIPKSSEDPFEFTDYEAPMANLNEQPVYGTK